MWEQLLIMENKTEKNLLKYEKVKEDIERKIVEGFWNENEVLRSENLMCEEYNVSRITIRRAIDELVQEGKLYKIKGKGCFVSKQEKEVERLPLYSFSDTIRNQGHVPSKTRISWEVREAGEELGRVLEIDRKDSVYVLKTLYKADDKPYCLNISVMPVDLFPNLDFFDFGNNSLYQVLASFYHVNFTGVDKKLYAVKSDDETRDILENYNDSPLLRVDARAKGIFGGHEKVFEIYRAYVLTDDLCYASGRSNIV